MTKNKKGSHQGDDDAVVQAVNKLNIEDLRPPKSGTFSTEWVAQMIAHIATSPIDNEHKALFMHAIAKGTFDLELYEAYLKLIAEYKKDLKTEVARLEKVVQELDSEIAEGSQQLAKAAVGACKEIQAAAEHIETRAIMQIEKVSEEQAEKDMHAIQAKLDKSKKK